MASMIKTHPVLLALAAAVVALLAWGFWPQPVAVEIVTAQRAPMTVTIEEEGRTRVAERYVIAAPVAGVACRQRLDVGDSVRRGETLLSISPLAAEVLDARSRAAAEARVAGASAGLRAAQERARAADARAELAQAELDRLRPLLAEGVIARGEYDRASTALETAVAERTTADFEVEVARQALAAARTALQASSAAGEGEPPERVTLVSPIDGRVLEVQHECEGPVETGQALLALGDPASLEVEVDVLSADAVRIEPGMPVVFERWGGEQPLEGRVRRIEPVGFTKLSALGVEEQRVWVVVDITSPRERWQRLGDGYRVDARFVLWSGDDVLQVPGSSLFRDGERWMLFVVEDGRAVRRTVEVGQHNGLSAQIVAGLDAGEAVINHPPNDVDDGGRVTGYRLPAGG
jgi:HlyD family secretion protein